MKYGWKPDAPDAPKFGGVRLKKHHVAVPVTDLHLVNHVPEIFDQGQTGSCVAQAAVRCIRTVLLTKGIDRMPSRLDAYAVGRVAGGESIKALTDSGTIPSAMVAALSNNGVCLETDWPFDEAKVNDPPPWDVAQKAAAAKITGFEKLVVIDQAKASIVAGHPVMFGMEVDQAYEDLAPGEVYTGPKGPSLGGHMQTIIGYSGTRIRVLNSWGASWCDGGYSWIDSSFLFGPNGGSDFYALDAAPTEIA